MLFYLFAKLLLSHGANTIPDLGLLLQVCSSSVAGREDPESTGLSPIPVVTLKPYDNDLFL